MGSLEIIGERVKRGEDPEVFALPKCSQITGTKQNKTWRQQRGFHQFRGELPGYKQNAQRLYNESLKTFPLGSLSLPLMHTHRDAFVYTYNL